MLHIISAAAFLALVIIFVVFRKVIFKSILEVFKFSESLANDDKSKSQPEEKKDE